ncbi:MAG: hypothetical protein ACRDNW_27330, partial [Trebonia sp.]
RKPDEADSAIPPRKILEEWRRHADTNLPRSFVTSIRRLEPGGSRVRPTLDAVVNDLDDYMGGVYEESVP